jgi:hypothetical protein
MDPVHVPLTDTNVLETGLRIVGYGYNKQATSSLKTKEELFMNWYGSLAKVCLALWNDLTTIDIGYFKIDNPELKYFLMTLHWLYCYPKLKTIATTFQLHPDTVGKYVWIYSQAIEALKNLKVTYFLFFHIDLYLILHNIFFIIELLVTDYVALCSS